MAADALLDSAPSGLRWLAIPAVAEAVTNALRHFDRERYDLGAYCVMPNHLHLILTPLARLDDTVWPLASLLHSLKSYSATAANRLLRRRGKFWQTESYDTAIRDLQHLGQAVAYLLNNPVAAGLTDRPEAWAWTYVRPEWLRGDN